MFRTVLSTNMAETLYVEMADSQISFIISAFKNHVGIQIFVRSADRIFLYRQRPKRTHSESNSVIILLGRWLQ